MTMHKANCGAWGIKLRDSKIKMILFFCCLSIFKLNAWAQTATFAPPQSLSGTSADPIETWGVSSVDINRDSCPDIYFGNHRLEPTLYLGNCDGTFVDRSDLIVGKTLGVDAHTTVFGDFHNDGCMDAHVSVGGSSPTNPLHANQLMFGELSSAGECSGVLLRQEGVDAEYPEQRGRSSVPLDVDYDGDLDLVTTGFERDSTGAGGLEEIFLNDGAGNLVFAPDSLGGEFDGHRLTFFNILADIDGNGELDLLCGENSFPRAQCSKDVSAFFRSGKLLSENITLDTVIPPNTNIRTLLASTSDAFAEDIDNDGDNDLVVLKRINRAGNATRLANNTVVESLNTTSLVSPMRCLGIPGEVDIESLVISGDYVNSRDIRFGANSTTDDIPNIPNISARRYVYNNINRANNIGLPLPDISDGVDENERGMYIGYIAAEQMWKICDVTGVGPESLEPAPRRRFNFYGIRAEFSGPVGELIHEGYDPDSAPRRPIVWINNGDNGNGTEFENTPDNGGINQAITAFGLGKGDFDNDGDVDFIASYENFGPRENHYLYTNDGAGTFTRSRFDGCPTGVAESVAILDANGDGRLDPVIACAWFGLAHDTSYAHSLWLNTSDNDNQAIMFSLAGNRSNRGGIGARITVTDADDRTQTVCRRDVGNTLGRGSQDSEHVHCGVALHSAVDVIIDWPGGSTQTIYDNVPSGGLYLVEEGSDTVTLIRNFDTNTSIGSQAADPQPFAIEITSHTVDEADNLSVSIELADNAKNDTGSDITVNYTSLDNTALSGTDYIAVSGVATIAPGEQRVLIDIVIIDDSDVETEESFNIQLSNASGATITNEVSNITITDNDVAQALPELKINSLTVDESVDNATLSVQLLGNASSSDDITVNYALTDGTAVAGSDYVTSAGVATIIAGQQSTSITIPIIDNTDVEPQENFNVQLKNASGATITTEVGVVTIIDNDIAETLPAIKSNFRLGDESEGEIVLFIQLENNQANTTQNDITVDYSTEDITAVAGEDYVPVAGTAVIAPGSSSTRITVRFIEDDIDESAESFRLRLSNPVGATVSARSGVVTIAESNLTATPVIGVNFRWVHESASSAALFIRLDNYQRNNTDSDITVDYTTVDDTATAGLDYIPLSGTAVIRPGERNTRVNVPIIEDTSVESSERFRLQLSNPKGAILSEIGGVVTIKDND